MSIFNPKTQEEYWRRKETSFARVSGIAKIPELDWEIPKKRYLCLSPEEALLPEIREAQILAACGAYYGDESKGKVNNLLAKLILQVCQEESKPCGSFRANSGANTGRTVYLGEDKVVLHLVPSALVYGMDSFIGPECVGDLISLYEEEITPYSNIVDFSHLKLGNIALTLPYHRIMDVLGSANNSSTGVGITQTHMSMKNKSCPRLDDLFNGKDNLEKVLEKDMFAYRAFLKEKGWNPEEVAQRLEEVRTRNKRVVPEHVLEFARASNQIKFLAELYREAAHRPEMPKRADVTETAQEILRSGGKVLVETTQSYFLANRVESGFKYATAPDTSLAGCLASLDLLPFKYKGFNLNVNKTPGTSRVGPGDIPGGFTDQNRFSRESITSMSKFGNACIDYQTIQKAFFAALQPNGLINPVHYFDNTGEYEIGEALAISMARVEREQGSTTGKPRIVGEYDCVNGAMVAERQGENEFISAMDRGEKCDYVGIVIAHVVSLPTDQDLPQDETGWTYLESNGNRYHSEDIIKAGDTLPSSSSQVTNYCLPVVRKIKGWKGESLASLKPGDYLPDQVADFITAENHYTGFTTRGIGTGPKENGVLFFKEVK